MKLTVTTKMVLMMALVPTLVLSALAWALWPSLYAGWQDMKERDAAKVAWEKGEGARAAKMKKMVSAAREARAARAQAKALAAADLAANPPKALVSTRIRRYRSFGDVPRNQHFDGQKILVDGKVWTESNVVSNGDGFGFKSRWCTGEAKIIFDGLMQLPKCYSGGEMNNDERMRWAAQGGVNAALQIAGARMNPASLGIPPEQLAREAALREGRAVPTQAERDLAKSQADQYQTCLIAFGERSCALRKPRLVIAEDSAKAP